MALMALLLAGALCVLAACGLPNRGAAEGKIPIQLSTWGSAQEMAVLKELLAEFEATHPCIAVELLHIPDNYYQKLHILVAGGMTPDVMFTNSLSFPVYATEGVFLDLAPRQGGETRDFYPQALAAFAMRSTPDGPPGLGALPRDISNVVVFYNREAFRRAGLPDPRPGWTWSEFAETAARLTVDANRDGHPERFGVSFYPQPPLFWLPFVWSAGGDLFSADGRHVTLDSPGALQGLAFYAGLRNARHVAPRQEESGAAPMSQLFLQGKLAMLVSGRWTVPVLREQARFDWDVAPLPVGPSGKSRVGIDASGYAVSAATAHPAESVALARFLTSRHAVARMAESGLIVPARPDVAQSAAFLAPAQRPRHGRVFLDVIADGVPTRTPPRWNEFSEELLLALQPVWEGRQSAAEAVAGVKPRLERLLEVGNRP